SATQKDDGSFAAPTLVSIPPKPIGTIRIHPTPDAALQTIYFAQGVAVAAGLPQTSIFTARLSGSQVQPVIDTVGSAPGSLSADGCSLYYVQVTGSQVALALARRPGCSQELSMPAMLRADDPTLIEATPFATPNTLNLLFSGVMPGTRSGATLYVDQDVTDA